MHDTAPVRVPALLPCGYPQRANAARCRVRHELPPCHRERDAAARNCSDAHRGNRNRHTRALSHGRPSCSALWSQGELSSCKK